LSLDCRLIANINGTVMPGPVFTRWFELKLIVRASDGGMEAVRRVPFIDQ
jgi:hypothetical protein